MLVLDIQNDKLYLYIELIINNLKITNNEIIKIKIKELFNIDVSIDRINQYFEPTVDELILDTYLLHKNLGLV